MPARPWRVAFAVSDEALEQALRTGLAARQELLEAGAGDADADLVIADGTLPEGDFGSRGHTLLVGSGHRERAGETVIESLDPLVILSAATVLAAGYRVLRDQPAAETIHLSTREKEVLALLVEGASNKLIARALDISVHTAKFHVTAVLEKLGARNRADAVAIALREGLVML